ncbi:MAG TPA: redoxin domain-containing protein [Dehalococcoidia bacterium]|nr:redoxin domain-containing protein [Dehalococcoidia bacterium]
MTTEQGPVRAPEFPPNATWLQGGPLRMSELRGRVVLIDFWDYTCVNCIRTLPYVKAWHERYADKGLTIVGVHAPEFSFARDVDNVRRAIERFGIAYPVVVDNDFALWKAYANRYWPAKYLVDKEGYLRFYHHGEGAYDEVERAIQSLLRDANPSVELPDLMEPVRPEDRPGAVCYRVTPELYLGYQRGAIGNTSDVAPDRPSRYHDVGKHAEGFFYLDGEWLLAGEYLSRPFGASGPSRLHVRYLAKDVNLVAHPPVTGGPARIEVLQDGRPLPAEDAGDDVRREGEAAVLVVDEPRMYQVVRNREIDHHELTLVTQSEGVALYAFTFTTCVAREEG